jgi:hypothetical protein
MQRLKLNMTSNTTLDLRRKYVSIEISTSIVKFWYNLMQEICVNDNVQLLRVFLKIGGGKAVLSLRA